MNVYTKICESCIFSKNLSRGLFCPKFNFYITYNQNYKFVQYVNKDFNVLCDWQNETCPYKQEHKRLEQLDKC